MPIQQVFFVQGGIESAKGIVRNQGHCSKATQIELLLKRINLLHAKSNE